MVDSQARSRPTDDITLLADTLMLALTSGGHERTLGARTTAADAALEPFGQFSDLLDDLALDRLCQAHLHQQVRYPVVIGTREAVTSEK